MPCGCGRSYIVNENYGFSNGRSGRKKDTSFKSFISWLVVLLLVLIVIYSIMVTIGGRKADNLRPSNATKENVHEKLGRTTTGNPWIFNKDPTTNDDIVSTLKPDEFTIFVEPQNLTTLVNKVSSTTETIRATKSSHINLKTTNTGTVNTITPTSKVVTAQLHHYTTLSDFFNTQITTTSIVDSDSTTSSNVFTDYISTRKVPATTKQSINRTELSDNISQTAQESDINKNILWKDLSTTTEFNEIASPEIIESETDTSTIEIIGEKSKDEVSVTNTGETTVEAIRDSTTNMEIMTETLNGLASQYSTVDPATEVLNKQTTSPYLETKTFYNDEYTSESGKEITNSPISETIWEIVTKTSSSQEVTKLNRIGQNSIEERSTVDFVTEGLNRATTSSFLEINDSFFEETAPESNKYITNSPKADLEIVTETSASQDVTEYSKIRKSSFGEKILDKYTTEDNVEFNTERNDFENVYRTEPQLQQTTFHYYNKQSRADDKTNERHLSDVTTELATLRNEAQKFSKDNPKIIENKNVCSEAVCEEKASQILRLMDHSTDPCEDFYQFSCGGVKNVDDSQHLRYVDDLLKHIFTSPNSKDKYLRTFRKFFDSCVNYENDFGYSEKIKKVLSSNVRDNNLTSLLAFLMLRQSTPLFEVRYGFVDNEEGYGMQILPPDLNYETAGLKEWSLQSQIRKRCFNFDPKLKYQSEVNLSAVYKDYNSCKEKTFRKMADNFVTEKNDRAKIPNKDLLKHFLSFFSNVNKISAPNLQNALFHQRYTKTFTGNLTQKYPLIDWQDFFNKITGTYFEKSTPIYLYLEKEYFEHIMGDLKDRMLKTEKEVIETLKLYYQLELYQNLLAPKQDKERFCMDQAVQLMPEIATKLFYEISGLVQFPRSLVESFFEELKQELYWLTEVSHFEEVYKQEFKNNLENLTLKVFQDDAAWKKYLEESHDSFYLVDDYLSCVFMFIETKRRRRFSLRSGDEGLVFFQMLDTQFAQVPTVIPNTNILVMPNRFLHKLMETQRYPAYIMESYLKFHLARALAWHYYDIAQKLDSTFYREFLNSLNSYWDNRADVKVLDGQRLTYKLENELWQHVVQWSETIRMADNIALDMAFKHIYLSNKTFKSLPWIPSDYTAQHQFFMLIVQEYCETPTVVEFAQSLYETPNIPSTFRIENMIINSEAFSTTFKCPQGTPMNPEEKMRLDSFAPIDTSNYYEYEQANK